MKKLISLMVCGALSLTALVGCGGNTEKTDVKDAHVFMFKSTGNTFGDLMYDGFEGYMESKGEKVVYKSPANATTTDQVNLIDELITQGAKSITISTNGDEGYSAVIDKAEKAGIKIMSVDSALKPEDRGTHVIPASAEGVGKSLVHAGVLIKLGVSYPADGDLRGAVETALSTYDGSELKIGVLSAGPDTPVQNSWIAKMEAELTDPIYAGKVSGTLDKKYGYDDMTKSTAQANAFVTEDKVDIIVSPTTVGIAAAGQVLTTSNSDIVLTGLGLPSEMQSFMPANADANEFDAVCPYMMLWDVIDLGRVSAAAMYNLVEGTYDGTVGSTFTVEAYGEYDARTMTTVVNPDQTGTINENDLIVIVGNPYTFNKGNIVDWVGKL